MIDKKREDTFNITNLESICKVTRRGYYIGDIKGISGIHSGNINFDKSYYDNATFGGFMSLY